MKKVIIISVLILGVTIAMVSCNGNRKPGDIYMPDMAYSRTYESYAQQDSTIFTSNILNTGGKRIFFNAMPARGTIKRGELFPYTIANDSNGYKISASVANPIEFMTGAQMSEAGRLYNINCGICHGEKGAANGPLSTKIGGIANLTLDQYKALSDGTIFHVLTYGKGLMGSYASQLSREQRWMVVKYVRTLQGGGATAAAAAGGKDSVTNAPGANNNATRVMAPSKDTATKK